MFTAYLSAVAPGSGVPTGVVTFTVGSTVFTAAVDGGIATADLATLNVGAHPVSAVYGGDASFLGTAATGSAQVVTCLPVVTVTDAADSGLGTLRRAIADVCTGGTIDFGFTSPTTITLTSGALELARNVTIHGPGAAVVAVSGGGVSRVFQVDSAVTTSIAGLTIRDGRVTAPEMAAVSPTRARWC